MFSILLMTLDEGGQNRILALWQKNGAALVHYALKELGSPIRQDDAEDIVSEAFEKLMTNYERYGGRTDEQMKGLLFRIVRNLCMDTHRREKRVFTDTFDAEGACDLIADPAEPSPEELVISDENVRRMKAVFRSLSPALRDVLEMKLNEEMTDAEIARELNITKDIVQHRLSRARKQVRIRWEEQEHEQR